MTLSVVILAAGQGKRMHSSIPKVLQPLGGKPMLEHVITTVNQIDSGIQPIIIYGHQGQTVKNAIQHVNLQWLHQAEQLGTGHALAIALPSLSDTGQVLVLYGDVPLISKKTLSNLIEKTDHDAIGILTAQVNQPAGLGRIIRDTQNNVIAIVEHKDADEATLKITEINSGIYVFPKALLKKYLPLLKNDNKQKEYYLTDVITLSHMDGVKISGVQVKDNQEILGVNDKVQLATLERYYQLQMAQQLMLNGVTIIDPARLDLRGEVVVGQDSTLDINVILEGRVTIGSHCSIGPNCHLKNVTIADHVIIKANSVIEGAIIANECVIGPFARIRPGTQLETNCHIGNFVEIKNSVVGKKSKINHLSYIGDSDIGHLVNVGAGTITCNYDGVNKHKTIIEDNAFIGSNSQLVAPITIGAGATIGAGSTITKNAPPHQLTLCRAPQRTIDNWQRPVKKEK